jgi:hypothetical protein
MQVTPVRDLDVLFRSRGVVATHLSIPERIELLQRISREHLADIMREWEIGEDDAYEMVEVYQSLGRRYSKSARRRDATTPPSP